MTKYNLYKASHHQIHVNTFSVGSPETELKNQKNVWLNVDHTGRVIFFPPVKFDSSCQVDMMHYPFDIQKCILRFGSWAYDKEKLDMKFIDDKHYAWTEQFNNSTEWELVNNTAERTELKYDCCPHPFVEVTYHLALKRRVTFHIRLVLVPTAILSALTLFIFFIPPNRPDRTVMGEYAHYI